MPLISIGDIHKKHHLSLCTEKYKNVKRKR